MLRLIDIEQNGDIISATAITDELEPQTFEVAVNIVTLIIEKNTLGEMNQYSRMAISKLFKVAEDRGLLNMPKSTENIWY